MSAWTRRAASSSTHTGRAKACLLYTSCQGIRDVGYDGVLSVEVFPLPDGETAARKSIEFFQKHFN